MSDNIEDKLKGINKKYSKKQMEAIEESLKNPKDSDNLVNHPGMEDLFKRALSKNKTAIVKDNIKKVPPLELKGFTSNEIVNIAINMLRRGEVVNPDHVIPNEILDLLVRNAVLNVSIAISKIAIDISERGDNMDKIAMLEKYLDLMYKAK